MPRDLISLACGECKRRNYTSTKNKKTTTERLELKKFCPHCRKHQPSRIVAMSFCEPRSWTRVLSS